MVVSHWRPSLGLGRGMGLSIHVSARTQKKVYIKELPRGRFDRSTSRTISTVCSISMLHSEPSSGHTNRTSIAILCHDASKSLCPSRRLAIPALPLQGNNFRNGVRFSVQTTSRGRVPCSRYKSSLKLFGGSLVGSKVIFGLVVRVESMKLSEAQNKPERALLRVTHLANDLMPFRPIDNNL